MKINSELIPILSMVVLLATSGIVSQLPVAFVFAEDGDDGGGNEEAETAEEVTEAETTAEEVTEAETTAEEVTEAEEVMMMEDKLTV